MVDTSWQLTLMGSGTSLSLSLSLCCGCHPDRSRFPDYYFLEASLLIDPQLLTCARVTFSGDTISCHIYEFDFHFARYSGYRGQNPDYRCDVHTVSGCHGCP